MRVCLLLYSSSWFTPHKTAPIQAQILYRKTYTILLDNTVCLFVQCRANAAVGNILTGSLADKLPEVECDVLQLWFTGDDFVCTEGQAKSSGQYVKAPGTFRSAMSHVV